MPTLQIPAKLDQLAAARQFVGQSVQQACTDQDFIYDLQIAIDEALTNIILHGYREDPAGQISIQVDAQPGSVVITVRDHASAFDPTIPPPPELPTILNQRRLGGMGIYLMRASTDEMIYRRTADGYNELKFIKHCPTG